MDFRVLGPLEVSDQGRTVALGGRKQRAVLASLVLEAGRVVSMERLISRLWGDEPPARATGTVQAYVSNLRRLLEPERQSGEPARVLVSKTPGYVLQVTDADVDWRRFERLVGRGQVALRAGDQQAAEVLLAEALALWRGPALADLGSGAHPEGARLEDLRLAAWEDLAEVRLALGRHAEVVADLETIAGEHPLRERLRSLQLLALYRSGRQADALSVYTSVRERLVEELGIDPGADLRRLHEQVLRQDPALDARATPPRPPTSSVASHAADGASFPFMGRAPELRALRRHLAAALAGSGRAVLVEGEPGAGKTRLAEVVAAQAAAHNYLTLWGRCAEGRNAPPLWPWTQVLRAIGDERPLAALVPNRARLDPQVARGQLSRALADLLRERSQARPVLLVLDDLHWADEASLALLEFLAADLGGARILVLGTYRDADLAQSARLKETMGVLARLPGADRVVLQGLSAGDISSLMRTRSHAATTPGTAEAVHRRTRGNAFFVTELLRLDDPAQLLEGPVPVGIRDVVRHRVARLPHAARSLLDTAALVGDDVDLRLVVGLCGFSWDTGLEAVEVALVEGLLTGMPGRIGVYRFSHALVRETLAGDLTPIHRGRLHERIALALLDAHGVDDEHAAEVAGHFWASLPAGDVERTLRAQMHAAEVAWAELAYESAEALLERASGLLRTLPSSAVPADIDLDVQIKLGSLRSARHGYTPQVRAAFDRARELAQRLGRRDELLRALWGLSATAVVRGDLTAARALTDTTLEEARRGTEESALATSHQGVGIVAFYQGRLELARHHFAKSLTAWEATAAAPRAVLHGPRPARSPTSWRRPTTRSPLCSWAIPTRPTARSPVPCRAPRPRGNRTRWRSSTASRRDSARWPATGRQQRAPQSGRSTSPGDTAFHCSSTTPRSRSAGPKPSGGNPTPG